MYKQDEEGLRPVCTKNTPSRIQVRGWRPFQITEELTEKDTASGETSSAGSGGRQTWRGPDAREGLHRGVMEGEPAASFQSQLRLGPSHTGNCWGWETTFPGRTSSRGARKLRRQGGGATPCQVRPAASRARTRQPAGSAPPTTRSGAEPKGFFRPLGPPRGLLAD